MFGLSKRNEQGQCPDVFPRRRCRSPDRGHNWEEMNSADGAQFVDGLIEFLAGDFGGRSRCCSMRLGARREASGDDGAAEVDVILLMGVGVSPNLPCRILRIDPSRMQPSQSIRMVVASVLAPASAISSVMSIVQGDNSESEVRTPL